MTSVTNPAESDTLGRVIRDLQETRDEVNKLRSIRDWAVRSLDLDYKPGDRIEIMSPRPSQSQHGWACYHEALAPGRVGIAGEIEFNPYSDAGRGRWHVLVKMDRCWSTHENDAGVVTRYWSGPADELPEGWTPSSSMNRTKNFSMPVDWVRRAMPYTSPYVGRRSVAGTHHAPRCGRRWLVDLDCVCGVSA